MMVWWPKLVDSKADNKISLRLTEKIKLLLFWKVKLVNVDAMKAVRRSRGIAPLILNFSTWWRLVVNFTLRLLYSRGRRTPNHCIGGMVDPRAGQDILKKRHTSFSYRNSNSWPSSLWVVAIPTALFVAYLMLFIMCRGYLSTDDVRGVCMWNCRTMLVGLGKWGHGSYPGLNADCPHCVDLFCPISEILGCYIE